MLGVDGIPLSVEVQQPYKGLRRPRLAAAESADARPTHIRSVTLRLKGCAEFVPVGHHPTSSDSQTAASQWSL